MNPERDITIRRCTLRVKRRGGWSWGADSQTLVRRAIERLPAALERRLAALAASLPDDLEISEPLRLHVPLRWQEWAELTGDIEPSARSRTTLETAIDLAMVQALAATPLAASQIADRLGTDLSVETAADAPIGASVAEPALHLQPSALWKLLDEWRAEGRLLARLARLSEGVMRLWLEGLIEVAPSRLPAVLDEALVPELWREVCALPLLMSASRTRTLARQIIFTLEFKTRWAPDGVQIRDLLAKHCTEDAPGAGDSVILTAFGSELDADAGSDRAGSGLPTPSAKVSLTHSAGGAPGASDSMTVANTGPVLGHDANVPEAESGLLTPSARAIASYSAGDAQRAGESSAVDSAGPVLVSDANVQGAASGLRATAAAILVHALPAGETSFELDVPCALPFLLLTPLSRAGYLATLAAALEAAHAPALAGGVAMGLAHKCLAPAQRGWLREPGALLAAAALAGRRGCDNDLVLNAGRVLLPQLAVLDACVTEQLVRSHRAEAGWLLARNASGALVLFDEDGLVPVAADSLASLAAHIAPSASVLFLPAQTANAEHLAFLEELQIPYATDANLTSRKSAASFVAPDGRRLWISVHGAQQGRARALAERGATLTEAARANWSAICEERTAQRPGIDARFEVSLSLAAGYALSAIAWALWRNRARATALAVIENFADLDARVRVTPERVHVTLPMGRRAWDLRDHGFLADVHDVPWLDGRVVTFGVG